MDDQTAHWRPEKYYAPPGTSVTVRANVYGGVPLGDGLYGEQDSSATFTIGGDAHVSVADDTTKQVSVFDNGKLCAPCRPRWAGGVAARRSPGRR